APTSTAPGHRPGGRRCHVRGAPGRRRASLRRFAGFGVLGLFGRRSLLGGSFLAGFLGRLLGLGLLLCFGLGLGSLGLAQFGVRLGGLDGLLGCVAAGFLALQGAFCSRQSLGGLPVAGHLQQGEDRVGGLGADTDPVTRTLTVDVDQRRLLGGVVLADLLDDAAVALFARIGDH